MNHIDARIGHHGGIGTLIPSLIKLKACKAIESNINACGPEHSAVFVLDWDDHRGHMNHCVAVLIQIGL